jgi:hypothetical protein
MRVLSVQRRDRDRRCRIDPSSYRCSALVAELADEAINYVRKASLAHPWHYAAAVRSFGAFADEYLRGRGVSPAEVTLTGSQVDLSEVIYEWEGWLRQRYGLRSGRPYQLTGCILQLLSQRAAHDPSVPQRLRLRAEGRATFRKGRSNVLDEFSNAERLALQRTARDDIRVLEQRLDRGRALLAAGADPRHGHGGWWEPANLVWAARHGILTSAALQANLPAHFKDWPVAVREFLAGWSGQRRGFHALMMSVAGLLFPSEHDLQPFRVLLLLGMGDCTPEELLDLQLPDVEFTDGGVRLTQTKQRAGRIRADLHPDQGPAPQGAGGQDGQPGSGQAYEGTGRWDVPGLLRRLLAATQLAREAFAHAHEPWLFLAVESAQVRTTLTADLARFNADGRRFTHWIAAHTDEDGSPALRISQPHEVRRLRKTAKTARVAALGGTVADLAGDDHHVEVFRSHYAHGTTAHVLAGRAVTRAQRKVFERVATRPVFIDAEAERRLDDPEIAEAVELTVEQAVAMRDGQHDMGLTHCRDPYDSPYTPGRRLCHVAPAMCMLCRNAVVFTSQLPRLLLLADHIERMRTALEPRQWTAVWGGQAAALAQLFRDCEAQLPAARQVIKEQQLCLDLPLGMRTEYDR